MPFPIRTNQVQRAAYVVGTLDSRHGQCNSEMCCNFQGGWLDCRPYRGRGEGNPKSLVEGCKPRLSNPFDFFDHTGCELMGIRTGATAFLSGSSVGVSRMETARPHEGQKRTFSEDTVPQPGQVTMRTDCIAPRGEAVKPHVWNRPGSRKQILSNRLLFTSHPAGSPRIP